MNNEFTYFSCKSNNCKHDWIGPTVTTDSGAITATCSKCGYWAINDAFWMD